MASINVHPFASLYTHDNHLFFSSQYPSTPQSILLQRKTPLKPFPAFTFKSQPQKTEFKFLAQNPVHDKSDPDDRFSDEDHLREECGIVGISTDPESSNLCYLCLHALQHRGQEAAGIVSVGNSGEFQSVLALGLVSEVFNEEKLQQLKGSSAIGHVRYSTSGSSSTVKNVQPFVSRTKFGPVAVAHNGNFVNYKSLRKTLEEKGAIFSATSDTEVVLHLIGKSKAKTLLLAVIDACEKLKGAYSMVILTEDKLIAVRDPFGFRPLVMGRRRNGAVVFASESCALDLIEAKFERDVLPGEVVVVENVDGDNKIMSLCLLDHHPEPKQCVFEQIYFSRPNSMVFGRSVYEFRHSIGEMLGVESPVECDVVIPVPDSGVVAALGYAAKTGVPFQQGLIRSHYVGRTFIEKSQDKRELGVKLKLLPVKEVLRGKRVVVVDDSLVRGTTSSKIVTMIREAGATEVHMRIASPPVIGSCYFGVDTPTAQELISNNMNLQGITNFIGADSLAFLSFDGLQKIAGSTASSYCYGCFTAKYPIDPNQQQL